MTDNTSIACVYVVGFAEIPNHYKIGRTDDLAARLKTLEWAAPFKVVVFHTIKSPMPHRIETELHRRFADKRVKLEWFRLTEEDLLYIKSIPADLRTIEDELRELDQFFETNKRRAKASLLLWAIAQIDPLESEYPPKDYAKIVAPYRAITPQEVIQEFVSIYVEACMWLGQTQTEGLKETLRILHPLFKPSWDVYAPHIEECIKITITETQAHMNELLAEHESAWEDLGYGK